MIVGKEVSDVNIEMPKDVYDKGDYIPTFNVYLIAIVRDSEGKIIRVHKQRSHSPTANFMGLFLPLSYYTKNNVSFTITNVTGGTCTYSPSLSNTSYDIPYPSTDKNYPIYVAMIQVGSGSQSNPYNAHSLAAPIANGSGAGQLVYQPVVPPSNIIVKGNTAYFTISQTFNNISGSTVTITEVGVILNLTLVIYNTTGSTSCGNLLVWYDVLSSPISVPNGGSVTIYYTFSVGS
jgi:hypothetical protein